MQYFFPESFNRNGSGRKKSRLQNIPEREGYPKLLLFGKWPPWTSWSDSCHSIKASINILGLPYSQ